MKRKTFYGFIALILTTGIIIACGVGSSWFTNGNIKTWFNSWGQGEKDKVETYAYAASSPLSDGAILLSVSDEYGITLQSSWANCPDCHSPSDFSRVGVEPTCTAMGKSVYACSYCDGFEFEIEDIPALGHNWPAHWSTVTAATCMTEGLEHKCCTRCNVELSTQTTPVVSHTPEAGDCVEPTCTTAGYKQYKCSRCNVETSRDTLPALGHDLTKLVNISDFYNIYECTRCNLHVVSFKQTPEKEGYAFAGWYYGSGDDCGENCRAYVGEAFYSNVDFHAHFNINVMTVNYVSDGENIMTEEVDWGCPVNPCAPEKTGYNFEGWYYSDGTKYEGQAIKSNTTLTAKFAIKRITVNFYVNGALYTTIEVDYGTVMETLKSEAAAHYLDIISLTDENGEVVDLSDGVTTALKIEAEKMTTWTKIATFFKLNWLWFVIGGSVLLAIGIAAGVTTKKKVG